MKLFHDFANYTSEIGTTKSEMSLILEHPRQVARHFGRSIRTIQRWIARGMPCLSDGLFDVEEIENWLKKQGPAEELKARPQEFEFLPGPVAPDVAALYGAGIAGLRKGLKTLSRALVLGGFGGQAARKITFQVLTNLLWEVSDGSE